MSDFFQLLDSVARHRRSGHGIQFEPRGGWVCAALGSLCLYALVERWCSVRQTVAWQLLWWRIDRRARSALAVGQRLSYALKSEADAAKRPHIQRQLEEHLRQANRELLQAIRVGNTDALLQVVSPEHIAALISAIDIQRRAGEKFEIAFDTHRRCLDLRVEGHAHERLYLADRSTGKLFRAGPEIKKPANQEQ